MSDFTRGSGPLSALTQQPKTRFETDPMASYQSPKLAAAAADEEPEDSGTAGLYRKARETLMASQSTGMDPLTTFLLAASQAGPGGIGAAIGRGGIAAQQAMAEGEKSEQAQKLKLLELGIEEQAAKQKSKREAEMLDIEREKLKAKEPKTPDLYYKIDSSGKQNGPFNVNNPEEYKAFLNAPGNAYKVGTEPTGRAEKPVGFTSAFEPTSDLTEVKYLTGAEAVKAKKNAQDSLQSINMSARVYNEVAKNPGAFTAIVGLEKTLPDSAQAILREIGFTSTSPEKDVARNKVFTEAAAIMVKMYGVAQSKGESARAKEWLPAVGDTYTQVQNKLRAALEYAAEQSNEIPDESFEKLPLKKEAIEQFFENRKKVISGDFFKPPPLRMTGDVKKDREIYNSLKPGDPYIDTAGKNRNK